MAPTSADLEASRLRVEIHGAVQGVGFRPFVYRLATELGLAGWVINDTAGVFIEVEGPKTVLRSFLERLPAETPPRAMVQSLQSAWLDPAGYGTFEIRHSDNRGAKTVLVLPDCATCPDCLAEVLGPRDRRNGYPFTNCTNCGPRFSIIRALPYDRPNTTMHRFIMCPACQHEYDGPLDRRFHAQPNACPLCGPQLAFHQNSPSAYRNRGFSRSLALHIPPAKASTPDAEGVSALRAATDALRAGQIVAVKGLGGFHLMVDAGNDTAVRRLRERKRRGDKPFAVMVRDLDQARSLCIITPEAEALLSSAEAPIVLLPKRPHPNPPSLRQGRGKDGDAPSPIEMGEGWGEGIAPDNPYLGIMLPYTPLHHLLLAELDGPIVATSGNLADEPICTDEEEAFVRLAPLADAFLIHDRPIARHVDDSITWIVAGAPRLLRRARGYAPLPVLLKGSAPTILAVGAHLKNTVALSVGRQVFISQHIGDLETVEAMTAFERVISDFLRLYEAEPFAIAHDMHPEYLSTKWAVERKQRTMQDPAAGSSHLGAVAPPLLVSIQHHHAHLAACLAENHAEGPALGITWDGTGYGPDGAIWGGEFLLGDATGYQRVAHLRPFRLPGGEAAVHEPRRVALALLWDIYGEEALEMGDLAPIVGLSETERRLLGQMIAKGINAPVTTSAGRLFDGVASLLGLQQRASYEGQAAMRLEFAADLTETGAYPLPFQPPSSLDWRPLVAAIVTDVRLGTPAGIMSARFHNGLVRAMVEIAQIVDRPRVALTGGCFQNRLLTERGTERLQQAGFEVLLHRQVPPNDGGISLGQVAVAAAQWSGVRHQ